MRFWINLKKYLTWIYQVSDGRIIFRGEIHCYSHDVFKAKRKDIEKNGKLLIVKMLAESAKAGK